MIKNIGLFTMVAIIALCIGLTLGIYIGHMQNAESITLIPSDYVAVTGPPHDYYYRDEVFGRININQASKEELLNIPGVGEATAQRIIDYRKSIGKFYSVDDLLNVSGIGKTTLDKMRPYITVGG